MTNQQTASQHSRVPHLAAGAPAPAPTAILPEPSSPSNPPAANVQPPRETDRYPKAFMG